MERRLARLGERIRTARLRRQLSAKLVAERAGMSVMTLRKVERGGMGVTIGAYIAVLHVLGLDNDLDAVAAVDSLGRELQDAALPQRARARNPSR
jgi:transcriptional regulator with XRE-family HTH domain